MKEIELLKSMWRSRPRRVVDLIVPGVVMDGVAGSLGNDDWLYHVPYGMRDALDIKLVERSGKIGFEPTTPTMSRNKPYSTIYHAML